MIQMGKRFYEPTIFNSIEKVCGKPKAQQFITGDFIVHIFPQMKRFNISDQTNKVGM